MDSLPSENKMKTSISKQMNATASGGSDSPQVELEGYSKKRRHNDPSLLGDSQSTNSERPCIMPLVPVPKLESRSVILNGTACQGVSGPPIGALDIGVSESAYYFRIALPGVKKDPGEFKCEIEHSGMVHIGGVTSTGGKTVSRHSRVFEMKNRQLCQSGAFTLSFSLPGPVDPRLFSPDFRSDGIFEAVVVKYPV